MAEPGKHTPEFHGTLQKILEDIIKTHKRVLFNGDGYKSDWLEEAAKRGLPNAPTTPDALKALAKKENVAVFEKAGVFSARELESRLEIALEDYNTKVTIEGNCALDMVRTLVVPAVKTEYAAALDMLGKATAGGVVSGTDAIHEDVVRLGTGLDSIKKQTAALEDAIEKKDAAEILASMVALRTTVDNLEKVVADDKWPLPKYREMLFLY